MKTVCVDLDGVLAQYDGWKGVEHIGDPIPGAREFLSALKALPAKVVIHTTRTNTMSNQGVPGTKLLFLVEEWLKKHDMPHDTVATAEGKPLAVAYVDDRAVVCRPLKDIENQDYDTALRLCAALVAGQELGSQGTYSDGKANEEDEGDLKLMVSSQDGMIRIDFGKPVQWLGFPPDQAAAFAELILKHARR